MEKLTLLFTGGNREAQKIIRYISEPYNFSFREEMFNFYLGKYDFFVEDYKKLSIDSQEVFDNIRSYLVHDFTSSNQVNFTLFCFAYYTVETYICDINKNFRDAMPRFFFEKYLKYNFIKSYEGFVKAAQVEFSRTVPFSVLPVCMELKCF